MTVRWKPWLLVLLACWATAATIRCVLLERDAQEMRDRNARQPLTPRVAEGDIAPRVAESDAVRRTADPNP